MEINAKKRANPVDFAEIYNGGLFWSKSTLFMKTYSNYDQDDVKKLTINAVDLKDGQQFIIGDDEKVTPEKDMGITYFDTILPGQPVFRPA